MYPRLMVVADRLLDIYCQLTGERHSGPDTSSLQTPNDGQLYTSEDRSTQLEGRILSLRLDPPYSYLLCVDFFNETFKH